MRILWALPVTLIGLLLGLINMLFGGTLRREGIALEATGRAARVMLWLFNPVARIEAITLGHVILACDAATAGRLRSHEHVHVRQTERWGILFPFAYMAASAIARLRGGDAYWDNCFEQEARAAAAR